MRLPCWWGEIIVAAKGKEKDEIWSYHLYFIA
jgi:hypothetical protein